MATLKVKSITDLDEFRSEWFERQEAEYAGSRLLRMSLFNVGTSSAPKGKKKGTKVKIWPGFASLAVELVGAPNGPVTSS